MGKFFYNFLISLASFGFSFFYWVKPKWKLRYNGLKDQHVPPSTHPRLWFHCASAGEYEQIAEVIETLSKALPEFPVFISFFSPSGKEWMDAKNIKHRSAYLPLDTRSAVRKFIKSVNPKCLIIAKNEFWPNLLHELHCENIPTFMVSAKVSTRFIGLKNNFFKDILGTLNGIYTQDEISKKILRSYNNNTMVSGDTRISRILSKSKEQQESKYFFINNRPTIIYGSMHDEDLGILEHISSLEDYNHIIVPHDVSTSTINRFKKHLGPNPTLSSQHEKTERNIMLIDEMGKLASLYRHAEYAYIGGGFSKGIHNIVEPLVHKTLVFIGSKYTKFQEATFLVEKGSIEVISHPKKFKESLEKVVNLPQDELQRRLKISTDYIQSNKEAVKKVTTDILKKLNNND